jgi:hypothetical protein
MSEERGADIRWRRLILDCFDYLADGDVIVRRFGFGDYFEFFFDRFPYEGDYRLPVSMTADEVETTHKVVSIMREALEDTPGRMSEDDFIATGWPERIRPIAAEAMRIFSQRGRLDEDVD